MSYDTVTNFKAINAIGRAVENQMMLWYTNTTKVKTERRGGDSYQFGFLRRVNLWNLSKAK